MSERSYRDIDQAIMLTVASVNLGLALGSVLVAVLCGLAFVCLQFAQMRGMAAPKYRKSIVYAMLVLGGVVWVLSPDYENAVSPFLVYIPAFFFMFLAFYQRLCRGNGGHDVFVLFNGLALLLFSCYNAHRISIGFNVLVLVLLVHAYGRPHVRWWKHILFVLLFASLTATSLAGLHYWRSHGQYRVERAADYYAKRHLMGFDPVVKLGSFESNYAGKYNRDVVLRVWDTLAPEYMRAAVYEKYVGGIWKLPAHRDRMLYAARYKVDYAVFEKGDSASASNRSRPVWVQSALDNFGFIFAPYEAVAVAAKNADSVEYFKSNVFKQGETRRGDWFYYMPTDSADPYATFEGYGDAPDSAYLQVFAPLAGFLDTVATEMGLDSLAAYPVFLKSMAYSDAISSYFLHNFTYSLQVDESKVVAEAKLGPHSDPLRIFWATRSGYCEYYATLSVLLLRRAGIPARYVTGFARPEVVPGSPYALFRRNSSHAWVEKFSLGRWISFDPTPPLFVVKVERPSWLSLKFESLRAHAARYFHLLRDGEWRTLLSSWQDFTQRALSNPLFYGVLVFAVVALAVLLAVRAYRRREKESGYDAAIKQLVRNLETAEKSLASLNLRREPGETVTAFAERCRTFEPGTEKRRIQLRRALEFLDEYNKKRWLPVKSGKSA